MLGTWKSKESDLTVEVVKVDGETVWYSMAAFSTLCPCDISIFIACSEIVPTTN